MSNSFKYVPVYESTKGRLDKIKGRKSYELILDEMLTYFEDTGIVPTSRMVSPVTAMKEQSNRVIEVVRGVEKKQNISLDAIYQLLKSVSFGTQGKEGSVSSKDDDPDYIHVTEVQKMITEHKELKENFQKIESKNRELIRDINDLKLRPTSDETSNLVNTNILLEILEQIEGAKKTATFNQAIYEVERTTFDAWVARLRDELNK